MPAPTCLGLAVFPSFHSIVPVAQFAVKVAFSLSHTVVTVAITVGAAGLLPLVITSGVDAAEVPHEVTQLAL